MEFLFFRTVCLALFELSRGVFFIGRVRFGSASPACRVLPFLAVMGQPDRGAAAHPMKRPGKAFSNSGSLHISRNIRETEVIFFIFGKPFYFCPVSGWCAPFSGSRAIFEGLSRLSHSHIKKRLKNEPHDDRFLRVVYTFVSGKAFQWAAWKLVIQMGISDSRVWTFLPNIQFNWNSGDFSSRPFLTVFYGLIPLFPYLKFKSTKAS